LLIKLRCFRGLESS